MKISNGLTTVLGFVTLTLSFLGGSGRAATITGIQTGPNNWTYDLTFAPLDNYSIFQPSTTITLTGLFGVVSATGPSSTDFPPFLDAINLDWVAAVLNGGTVVQWTHAGPGTGNFGVPTHVFGFGLTTAGGAVNGPVQVATSGISRDTSNPLPDGSFNVDRIQTVNGPT